MVDWSHLPRNETLLFFDDHQNAYERLKTAKWFGFKHVIFEDNYPAGQGDCYSLKHVFAHAGFSVIATRSSISNIVRRKLEDILGITRYKYQDIGPNKADAQYLSRNLDIYYEFPPVFKAQYTRWNDCWDEKNYPTPEPLKRSVEYEFEQMFEDEAIFYTWMCYVKLKE